MSEAPAGGKFCMVLLEGIGCSDSDERNAVKKAHMEYLNSLKVNENCVYRELDASGLCVGLKEDQAAPTTLSASVISSGKRRYPNNTVLDHLIEAGTFQTSEALTKLLADVIEGNGRIHFVGCLGDEDVAKMQHLKELVTAAKVAGVSEIYIHGFTGNDSSTENADMLVVKDLESWLEEEQCAKFGSLSGMQGLIGVYALLARVEAFYKMLMQGSNTTTLSASEYLQQRYDAKETDSDLTPVLLTPSAQLQDGDHVVLFNHNTSSNYILKSVFSLCDTSLTLDDNAKTILKNLAFLSTAVKPNIHLAMLIAMDSMPCPFLFASDVLRPAFSSALSEAGKRQLFVMEDNTAKLFQLLQSEEKGKGVSDVVRINNLIKKKKMTDDLALQHMQGVASMACMAMAAQRYDAVYLSFAGAIVAALKQSEMLTTVMCMEIDRLLKQVCEAATQHGYAVVIVGTDGLATRVPQREEVAFPVVKVPCVVVPARGEALEKEDLEEYSVENVAATCLRLVGVEPKEYMAPSLIKGFVNQELSQ